MTYRLILADARNLPIADKSVQCCVTSPPFWGLRDYGINGQLGLEQTPERYVANMVAALSEVHRVLRDDGVLFLNLGDSYNAAPNQRSHNDDTAGWKQASNVGSRTAPSRSVKSLKRKDLVGIPWRVAFALQADGWYLRQWMPWIKRSAMTESVDDRPTSAIETFFLLTKSAYYYYDAVAVRRECAESSKIRLMGDIENQTGSDRAHGGTKTMKAVGDPDSRSYRNSDLFFESLEPPFGSIADEWGEVLAMDVTNTGFKGAHFATYPPKLIEPLILAGTSAKGCCAKCGAPWERMVEKTRVATRPGTDTKITGDSLTDGNRDPERHVTQTVTKGWEPGCKCGAEVVPCTVLDPFNGAGTTGLVSVKHGRDYIGTDINPDYLKMADERIRSVAPLFVGAA